MATTAPHSPDTTRTGRLHLAGRRVRDAMSTGLITCEAGTELPVVAEIMAAARIHCVVVEGLSETNERAWGIMSDLDLVAASAPTASTGTAAEVAATEVLTVTADETLERGAQLMAEHELSHLVVVDPLTGLPAGILSTLDIVRELAGSAAA